MRKSLVCYYEDLPLLKWRSTSAKQLPNLWLSQSYYNKYWKQGKLSYCQFLSFYCSHKDECEIREVGQEDYSIIETKYSRRK